MRAIFLEPVSTNYIRPFYANRSNLVTSQVWHNNLPVGFQLKSYFNGFRFNSYFPLLEMIIWCYSEIQFAVKLKLLSFVNGHNKPLCLQGGNWDWRQHAPGIDTVDFYIIPFTTRERQERNEI